ncbi:MAG: NAD(P)/FAD-dependent oxidoreductase [Parachlamydiaceae bacterium]
MYKIAIVGGGFCGLSLCLALYSKFPDAEITLFEPEGDGGGASKISTGLMHKYVGVQAKLSQFGEGGLRKSLSLIRRASERLGTPLILSEKILRIPANQLQEDAFRLASENHDDLKWVETESIDPLLPRSPSLLIESGYSVDSAGYLKGLMLMGKDLGLNVQNTRIETAEQLSSFDFTILATGAAPFPGLEPLKVHPVKGQLLEIAWPKDLKPLPCSLIGSVYIAMSKNKKSAIIGATYEHVFHDAKPDREIAVRELYQKACSIYPPLEGAAILDVRAGLRASMPNRMPFAGKIGDKLYALVGMGSKGLLYHAYFADQLVESL